MRRIYLTALPTTEVSGVGLVYEEEVESSNLPEAKESPLFIEVKNNRVEYNECLRRKQKSENFEAKQAADKALDDAWVGSRQIVLGLTYSPDPVVRERATRLYSKLDMYGAGIEKLKDTDESVKIGNILVELDKPENKQLILDLNVKAYIDEVRLRADSFRRDWGNLETDKEAFRNSVSATSTRRKFEASLVAFYDFVAYSAQYAPTKREEWAKLESAIYSRYTTIRQKYAAPKKDDTTPSTDSK